MDHLELYIKHILIKLDKLLQLKKYTKIKDIKIDNYQFLDNFIIQILYN